MRNNVFSTLLKIVSRHESWKNAKEMNFNLKQHKQYHYGNRLIESFHLYGHTFRFRLEDNELSSVITQTVPLECTQRELSFE